MIPAGRKEQKAEGDKQQAADSRSRAPCVPSDQRRVSIFDFQFSLFVFSAISVIGEIGGFIP